MENRREARSDLWKKTQTREERERERESVREACCSGIAGFSRSIIRSPGAGGDGSLSSLAINISLGCQKTWYTTLLLAIWSTFAAATTTATTTTTTTSFVSVSLLCSFSFWSVYELSSSSLFFF
jgi:hypothetical protein